MIPLPLQPLANHLWQSTLFAALAGLLTLALRRNRAQLRYCLWLVASVKFLVPFSVLVIVGSHLGRHPVAAVGPSILPSDMEEITQSFLLPVSTVSTAWSTPSAASTSPVIWFAIWAFGVVTLLSSWWRRCLQVRAALRTATPVRLSSRIIPVMSSPWFIEPGVFGVWRPVLLVPEGIAELLTTPQLEAVLAHECCHIRRHDNLAAAIHMVVESLFWFHPLVWWLGARLMDERERACDEDVLQMGNEPEVYAEGILRVCELYLKSPLKCVAGVTGANLRTRIEQIMSKRVVQALNGRKKLLLASTAALVLAVPIIVGTINAPVVMAQVGTTSTARPKFEVASIKLNTNCGPRRNGGSAPSPGRADMNCTSLGDMIQSSYGRWANGPNPNLKSLIVLGVPSWVDSDLYDIEAKAEGKASLDQMYGPMLQTLLEDRFKLKVHWEVRELPVYALTVAKGGIKMARLPDGSCIIFDINHLAPATTSDKPTRKFCGRQTTKTDAGSLTLDAYGMSMHDFSEGPLSARLDRPVIDKTGLPGIFDFHVKFSPDDARRGGPGPPEIETGAPAASLESQVPSIFTALQQQLGLKLESTKGPVKVLVVDHVERPSPN